jgi:nicotinamidase/pyrazinamidase
MVEKKVIFWDVDTQFDFMKPEGKLYVPGADKIIPAINKIRKFALDNGFSIIASSDWHSPSDKEISQTPDFKETFPQHCLASEPGSERIGFLGKLPIEYVEPEPMDTASLKKLVDKEQFHIVLRKSQLDVFSNPNTTPLLELIRPEIMVVFGVALDICVLQTVSYLLSWGKSDIIVLADGVKGLGKRPDEQILKEFEQKRVRIKRLGDLRKGILNVVT